MRITQHYRRLQQGCLLLNALPLRSTGWRQSFHEMETIVVLMAASLCLHVSCICGLSVTNYPQQSKKKEEREREREREKVRDNGFDLEGAACNSMFTCCDKIQSKAFRLLCSKNKKIMIMRVAIASVVQGGFHLFTRALLTCSYLQEEEVQTVQLSALLQEHR